MSFLRLSDARLLLKMLLADYTLLSLMLKFTRMQAEVMKFIIDLGPVPARYSNLFSVFYIW